jgi:PhnB protein
MNLVPYLYFSGRAEAAIAFYEKALGAKVEVVLRFKDNPEPANAPPLAAGWEEKVMHASLRIGESEVLLSDGCSDSPPCAFQGFSLTLRFDTEAEVDATFNALLDGGEARMPLMKTFFAKRFGMVVDRFGVLWTLLAHA